MGFKGFIWYICKVWEINAATSPLCHHVYPLSVSYFEPMVNTVPVIAVEARQGPQRLPISIIA